ncbi:MAG: hypothetical protein ACYCOO_05985 [Chitinophagaceae bacterium]
MTCSKEEENGSRARKKGLIRSWGFFFKVIFNHFSINKERFSRMSTYLFAKSKKFGANHILFRAPDYERFVNIF